MMNLNEVVEGVELTKVCSIKADKDSKEVKSITLKVDFGGVKLQDVFTKALAQTVIQWQNGPGRKQFNSWSNKEVVKINFKAPATTVIDPKQALLAEAKAAGIDISDKDALTSWIMSKF